MARLYVIKYQKSFSGDLKAKFPDGRWITSNGSRIFIVPSKGGKNKVVAGLGGFNGIIDEKFKEENGNKEVKSQKIASDYLEKDSNTGDTDDNTREKELKKEQKLILKEWRKFSNEDKMPPIELQQRLTQVNMELKRLAKKLESKPIEYKNKPK